MHAILAAAGIVDGGDGAEPTFNRGDGSEARVASQAQIYEDVRLTPEDPRRPPGLALGPPQGSRRA